MFKYYVKIKQKYTRYIHKIMIINLYDFLDCSIAKYINLYDFLGSSIAK